MPITVPGFTTTISLAKQGAQGTANVPSSSNVSANTGYSLRWLAGSKVLPHADTKTEQEGDGSRSESLHYKTGQWATGKTICYARPREAAMLFTAFSGTGSDTHTGSGSPYTHTIRPTTTSAQSDYYTLLMTVNKGSGTTRFQATDAVCNKIMVTAGAANPPLKLDGDWIGGANSMSTGSFTPTLTSESPFYWFNGVWSFASSLIGSNTDWTAVVQDLSLTFENELTPTDFIAEQVTPLPLTTGNLKVSGNLTLLWQDGGVTAASYFNGGTSDDPAVATGDLSVTFACASDPAQTLTIHLPQASWSSPDFEPDLSGKPIQQKIDLVGLRGSGGYPYEVVCLNAAGLNY